MKAFRFPPQVADEMIRAILDGQKNTMRLFAFPKEALREFPRADYPEGWWFRGRAYCNWDDAMRQPQGVLSLCKYRRNDILYIQETWRIWKAHRYDADAHIEFKAGGDGVILRFPHGCTDSICRDDYDHFTGKWGVSEKWHPSIHMPREVARIFLRVTNVTVEPLKNIEDGWRFEEEGIILHHGMISEAWRDFAELWNAPIKPADLDLCGWDANPWVFVIKFERISKEEALINS